MSMLIAEAKTDVPFSPDLTTTFQSNRFIFESSVDDTPRIARYGFRIGAFGFLFPDHCSGEVIVDPAICPIPYTRDWMLGVIALRGSMVPVFDLQAMLFETPIVENKPKILVLDQGDQAMGFVLKNMPEWLTELAEQPLASVSIPEPIAEWVEKVYRHRDTLWLTFDKSDLFSWLGETAKAC